MSFFSAFEVCAELWCMLQATTVECSWDHSMRCVDVSHYYLICTYWIHFYHILCFVVCRHSKILWFGHTVSYLPSIESWFTFYWPTVLKDKCFWITHTYVPNIIGLHSDRCQYITELSYPYLFPCHYSLQVYWMYCCLLSGSCTKPESWNALVFAFHIRTAITYVCLHYLY